MENCRRFTVTRIYQGKSIVSSQRRNFFQFFSLINRSTEFDVYLSKVSEDRKVELDNLLLKELNIFFRLAPSKESTFGNMTDFLITQKNSTKYFEASKYQIHLKNNLVKTFDDNPKLHDLHDIVNKNKINGIIEGFNAIKNFLPSRERGEM